MKKALAAQEKEEELSEDDLSFDELDFDDDTEDTVDTVATQSEPQPEALEEASKSEQKPNEELEVKLEAETEQKIEAETEQKEEKEESEQEAEARTQGKASRTCRSRRDCFRDRTAGRNGFSRRRTGRIR